LVNIADAIRRGVVTSTTRAMLEEAERRVARFESLLGEARRAPNPVVPFAVSVERYLRDLRATVNTNPEKARRLLSRAVERIVLKREGPRLVADVYGTLAGVLDIGDTGVGDSAGAGRGI
ncbi:MAG TPA: hypothetical protein VEZ44_11585, partial [bacterium]|nr:hypothetical protein [bacterium]